MARSESDPANPYKTNSGRTASDVYVLGDVDLNGDVDSTDPGLPLNNFTSTAKLDWLDGNLDGDSVIDSTDLGLLLNKFAHTSASAAIVPESGSLSLWLIAVASVALRRRDLGRVKVDWESMAAGSTDNQNIGCALRSR